MLLVPNDPRSVLAPRTASPASTREEVGLNYFVIALSMALISYSLLAGIGLANGTMAASRAFLLMTPVPVVLALWHGYGAWRTRFLEVGLLLLAAGWGMVFLTLLLKHAGVQSALAQGQTPGQASDSPLVWLAAFLSVGLLGAGAWMSFSRWRAGSPSS